MHNDFYMLTISDKICNTIQGNEVVLSNGISIISNEHISMKIYTSPIIGRLVSNCITFLG